MRHIKKTLFIWSTYVCRMIRFEVLDLCRLHYCIDHLSSASLPIDISWSRFVDTCICYSLVILFCNRACRVHFSLTSSSTAFSSTICRGFIVDMSVFYVRARVIFFFFCSRFNTSSHMYVFCDQSFFFRLNTSSPGVRWCQIYFTWGWFLAHWTWCHLDLTCDMLVAFGTSDMLSCYWHLCHFWSGLDVL